MVISAAGADAEAVVSEAGGNGLGVFDDLRGVFLELGLERLAEADGLGGDDVHERATLDTGKNLGIDFFGKFFFAQNDTTAWATE